MATGRSASPAGRGTEDARPGRAAGDDRRTAGGLRGDGRRPDPLGALLEHQGASGRLDRAVRRRRADGHAGRAHPRPSRRDGRRRRRPSPASATSRGCRGSSTIPSPAGRTCRTSRYHPGLRARRAACRVRRQPGPPRRRRCPHSRVDAGRQPHAGRGGRCDLAAPAEARRTIEELVARMRQPAERRADLRAQLAANRAGSIRLGELAERLGPAPAARGRPTPCSTTPSGAPAPALPGSPTACAGPRTSSRRPRAISCCACEPRLRGEQPGARFHAAARPSTRQPQLPAGRDRLGLPVRGARPHRPGYPGQRRRETAGRGDRAPRAAC